MDGASCKSDTEPRGPLRGQGSASEKEKTMSADLTTMQQDWKQQMAQARNVEERLHQIAQEQGLQPDPFRSLRGAVRLAVR